MADLNDYRREIDEIDGRLIPLFERRMEIVREVGRYKREHGLPVLQAGREEEILQKAADFLKDKGYASDARRFMRAVMEISRGAQSRSLQAGGQQTQDTIKHGTVGYYGIPGSFSEQALIDLFSDQQDRMAYAEFRDVFEALKDARIDYGVLPIENSSSGAISAVYDLLGSYGFYIVGERRVRISQNLAAAPGASLDSVTRVYSHEQGLIQCSEFLSRHGHWTQVSHQSTATSAKLVAEAQDPAKAAICSPRAASLYGLQILASDIQNHQENTTRFILIGRELESRSADKVSLVFTLDHESGTLYQTLRYFAERGISLVKIESRPIPDVLWNYRFYLDFEGDIDNQQVKTALDAIAEHAKDFRVLGAYRSDKS